MKKLIPALVLAAAISIPVMAEARAVKLTTQLKNYGGPGAYMVVYLTDAQGAYKGTIWMSGGYSKYYGHLSDWSRASGGRLADINGITGASVGSGQTLTITTDLADALIDAGYKIHIDTAVENYREAPSEVVVPLSAAQSGKSVNGRRYISTFQISM